MEYRQSQARLTFTQNQTTPLEIYKGLNSFAYLSYGNQQSQLERFHQKFVRKFKWLSESQFRQIVNLCWALPGPTVVQVIITMTILKTKSSFAGFIAFLIFSIPSWIILSILGSLSKSYAEEYHSLPVQLKLMFLGFTAAGSGVMVKGFMENLFEHYNRPEKLFIMISSTIIFLIFKSTNAISFCLVLGAIISLYSDIQIKKKMSAKSEELMRNANYGWVFGKVSVYSMIIIYIIFWVFFSYYPDSRFLYTWVNYFVGCVIIGPLNTIFAYFYANYLETGLITDNQFWIGLPLAFLTPGSIINVGIFYGSIIDGVRGVLLSAIFLYLPCFLSIYGILPQWRYYRDKPGVQRLIIGLTCVTSGFVLAIIIMGVQYCIRIDTSMAICIFLVSIFQNYVCGFYSLFVILIGGFLANTRRWGLIYYRMEPDRQY